MILISVDLNSGACFEDNFLKVAQIEIFVCSHLQITFSGGEHTEAGCLFDRGKISSRNGIVVLARGICAHVTFILLKQGAFFSLHFILLSGR